MSEVITRPYLTKIMNRLGIPVLNAAILLLIAGGMMGVAGELCARPDLSRYAVLVVLADSAFVIVFVILAEILIYIERRH
jgi:hypothetical protein